MKISVLKANYYMVKWGFLVWRSFTYCALQKGVTQNFGAQIFFLLGDADLL